jgi:hypothetical protein
LPQNAAQQGLQRTGEIKACFSLPFGQLNRPARLPLKLALGNMQIVYAPLCAIIGSPTRNSLATIDIQFETLKIDG